MATTRTLGTTTTARAILMIRLAKDVVELFWNAFNIITYVSKHHFNFVMSLSHQAIASFVL